MRGRWTALGVGMIAALFAVTLPTVHACTWCGAQSAPLAVDIAAADMVVFGHIASAKLGPDGVGGTSELAVEAIFKAPARYKDLKTLPIAKYVPPDPKAKLLLFVGLPQNQFDVYRGILLNSDRIVPYLQNAPVVDPQAKPEEKAERLLYYFKFLDHVEPEISGDAYKQWASATDREVGLLAPKLPVKDLRKWLLDPKTPTTRLSLYAYLLGACGNEQDANLLRGLVLNPDERMHAAVDGLLGGYISLRPDDGWKLTQEVIADKKRPFTQRHSVMRLLRFYYGFQPEQVREKVLQCCAAFLRQGDIFDIAVDQLRTWALWDLTPQVLALYGTKDADAPIAKRSIVRYALACPLPEAKVFTEKLRQKEPTLIDDVQESLKYKQSMRPAPAGNRGFELALCIGLGALGLWIGRWDARFTPFRQS